MTVQLVFIFFQAEDGIRDLTVTGVQTCALPISLATRSCNFLLHRLLRSLFAGGCASGCLRLASDERRPYVIPRAAAQAPPAAWSVTEQTLAQQGCFCPPFESLATSGAEALSTPGAASREHDFSCNFSLVAVWQSSLTRSLVNVLTESFPNRKWRCLQTMCLPSSARVQVARALFGLRVH